jgi:hypothetical protein
LTASTCPTRAPSSPTEEALRAAGSGAPDRRRGVQCRRLWVFRDGAPASIGRRGVCPLRVRHRGVCMRARDGSRAGKSVPAGGALRTSRRACAPVHLRLKTRMPRRSSVGDGRSGIMLCCCA